MPVSSPPVTSQEAERVWKSQAHPSAPERKKRSFLKAGCVDRRTARPRCGCRRSLTSSSPQPPRPASNPVARQSGDCRTLGRDRLDCRPHSFNVRADHVDGLAPRLDIVCVLRCARLTVVAHHGRKFAHLFAQLTAYLLGAFPDRVKQCLALRNHLLRRIIGLVDETERDFDSLIAARCDPLVEHIT